MSVEISSDILSICKYRWYHAFSSKTSVEFSIDILHLFAKCRWKFPSTYFLSIWRYRWYLLLLSKRRWNFSLIFYICLQNVDGNFHRDFLSVEDSDDILLLLAKRRWKNFNDILHLSMEISIDILLLSVNPIRICEVFSQIFRVISLQKRNSFYSNALLLVKVWSFNGFLTIPWDRMSKFGLS
jgi:hypothetical protein